MSFSYENGLSGIRINNHDLSEFSCKLLSTYTIGACQVETDMFQGKNRSSLLLLDQTFGAMEIVLPLEFWGESRQDTMEKWSSFCKAVSGKAELDLGDGFLYACVLKDLGTPAFITDGWLAADVTLSGLRQKPQVTISTQTDFGSSVYCESTFPRTDCVVRLPKALLGGADQVSVELGDQIWTLSTTFSGTKDLVLDGVSKIFRLGSRNVTAQMEWEDFPYLVPGSNHVAVFINTVGITRGVEIKYRPTFL